MKESEPHHKNIHEHNRSLTEELPSEETPESAEANTPVISHQTSGERAEIEEVKSRLAHDALAFEGSHRPSVKESKEHHLINPELEKERQQNELNLINRKGDTFLYGGIAILNGIRNLRTLVTGAEIEATDAASLAALRKKAEKGRISPEEQEELAVRESGNLFGYSSEVKVNAGAADTMAAAINSQSNRAYIEYYIVQDVVVGTQEGKEISLTRNTYPGESAADQIQDPYAREVLHVSDWKGPKRYEYAGEQGGKKLSQKHAEALFERYYDIARDRMKTLKKLKENKERQKYGKPLREPLYQWKHRVVDDL